jgi:hypothetical protein
MMDMGGNYAIFWINENGKTGCGEYILDEATLRAWLGQLRGRYPEMQHWGQLPNGERYIELPPIEPHHEVSFSSLRI